MKLWCDKNIQVSSLKVARTEHVMSLIYGVPTIIGWLHHTIYHHHHIHYRHHLNDDDHQAEWTGISSSLLWSSSTKVGTAGTFLSGEIGGLLTRSIWWRSEMIKRKIMIIWKKHYWWCSWKWNLTRGWEAVSWDEMIKKNTYSLLRFWQARAMSTLWQASQWAR